jgi:hypothetical protein
MNLTKKQVIEVLVKDYGFEHEYVKGDEHPNIISKKFDLATFSTDDRGLEPILSGAYTLDQFDKFVNVAVMDRVFKTVSSEE